MRMSITLFRQRYVNDVWVEQRNAMKKECAQVSDEEVMGTDLEELSQQIAKPYHFDVPELLFDQLNRDEPIFTRDSDVAHLKWYIPFCGDCRIFGYFDRNSPLSPVYNVTFENGVMEISTSAARDRIPDSKKMVDGVIGQVKQYLPDIKRVLEDYNQRFAQFAKAALEKRKTELIANQIAIVALSKLAVPVRKRTDEIAEVFVPPARKTIPIPDGSKTVDVTPVLEMRAYDDILSTITAMAHGIERSPETFEGMDEEDIRIVLLIGLNATYEGKATGETFNGIGKSDILIRVADKNIFIAECLVWDGETKFRRKLDDQLLNYIVWRDTKAALIVFNRTKNLTAVVKTIDVCLSKHPQFVRNIPCVSETELRYEFRRADDPARRFHLTCLVFNVPEKPKSI